MPAYFYIDSELGVVFSKATGVFSRADALDHMERLSRHPDFRPELNQLADFRQITKVDLSSEEIRELAKMTIFSARSQRAFVVSSDLQFGLGRVFASYREIRGETGIMIFRQLQDALNWLSISSEPDAKVFTELGSFSDKV